MSPKDGVQSEVAYVTLHELPACKTQKEAQQAYRIIYIDDHLFAVKSFANDVAPHHSDLHNLTVYKGGRLAPLDRDLEPNCGVPRFKCGTVTAARVLKAVHLLGFLTRTQYQAAEKERLKIALAERAQEEAKNAEQELLCLFTRGLTLSRAKKLIDGWTNEERKQAGMAKAVRESSSFEPKVL